MNWLPGISLLSMLEPVLLAATLCALVRARAYKKFPAFGAYLACRLGIYAVLDVVLHAARHSLLEKHLAYQIYYYVYWVGYLVGAWLVFLVIQEVFTHLMDPLPGLGRLGLVAFRWVTLTSVLIAIALSVFPVDRNRDLLISATSGVMRCMSILQLCLLAFIVLSMHSLRLSLRSRDFGIAFGLSLIAASDMFGSAFAFQHTTLASVANYSVQVAIILAMSVWIAYFMKAEWQTRPVTIPVSSPLLRWNEIAIALGHPPPQIVLPGSSTDFFLDDVEKAVDRILEKNSMNPIR